jgi:hypothetical protein
LKSKDGRESKSDTSIVDPGAALARSGEFSSACARDKPAIPVPMIATRWIGGDVEDGATERGTARGSSKDIDNVNVSARNNPTLQQRKDERFLRGAILFVFAFGE